MKILASLLSRCVLGLGLIASGLPAFAAGDLTRQEPIDVTVQLGTEKEIFQFEPSHLTFETGKLYRLTLVNQSPTKHYFSSPALARSVFTRKVETFHQNGDRSAEIKGQITEIEVFPNAKAQWWFVPIQTGDFDDLKCTVSGHADHGMTGRITIQ